MHPTTWLRSACAWGAAWIAVATASAARAETALFLSPVKAGQIRVDGELGEWRGARFIELGAGAKGAAVRFALGFDDDALYLAARVSDDSVVRSASPSRKEDALVLTLAAPRASGRPAVSELWLFPGIPGKHKSSAAIAAPGGALRELTGAAIVEGPSEQGAGYVLEARLPLAAIEGHEALLLGRGALRMHDVDARSAGSTGSHAADTVASASGAPERLPELMFDGGPNMAVAAFARDKGLPPERRFERFGDVTGDARIERVAIAGSYLLMASAERSGGFRFIDLPIAVGAGVRELALEDRSGDGKLDIVVRVAEPEADAELTYRCEGGRFVLHGQQRTPNAKARAAQAAETQARARDESIAPAATDSVVYDEPPGMDELVAAYRKARGVPASVRPRFVTHANVAEDARIESLMLFDRELLVVGRGFRGGTGFFYFGLPVADGAHIQRMFTGDVTGDGRREVFIRMKQLVGDVQREILLGYTFDDAGDDASGDASLKPILATEVRRAQGENSIGNVVRLVRAARGRGFELHIDPGVARGYTRETYPFVAEATDGYGAPLLPWLHEAAMYGWDGARLMPRFTRVPGAGPD